MTRWAIVADLNRCVGCQTCTAACKHANATAPGVQWRKVIDFETGDYPDVRRAFVPVGCMHCEDPPCLDVCPTTATRKRPDGIVTIDYDLCFGCAYCVVACPYQARARVDRPSRAYGGEAMRHEAVRESPARLGVSQKCTFCAERIDAGLAQGLVPGVDAHATPACVNACIADALHFGDADDPDSNVSRLMSENRHFRMHEELGAGPHIAYLWDKANCADHALAAAPAMCEDAIGMAGAAPLPQKSWDWRAAANFILGGAGSGLLVATALAGAGSGDPPIPGLLALAMIGAGLGAVWLELGRPLRFLNVFLHPQRSWMTREAYAAVAVFAAGGFALLTGQDWLWAAAAVLGLVFLYCQARIIAAAKGIPAWREPQIVPLIFVTGLSEGFGLYLVWNVIWSAAVPLMITWVLLAMIVLRHVAWRGYRRALGQRGAPTETFIHFDEMPLKLDLLHLVPALILLAIGLAASSLPILAAAGVSLVVLAGWIFKFILITRACHNQGYAIDRMPARGAGRSAPGVRPGWRLA